MKKTYKIILILLCFVQPFIGIPAFIYIYWKLHQNLKFVRSVLATNEPYDASKANDAMKNIIKFAKHGHKKSIKCCNYYYFQIMNNKLTQPIFLFENDVEDIKNLYYQSTPFDKKTSLFDYIKPDCPTEICSGDHLTWIVVPNATPEAIKSALGWNKLGDCNWHGLSECLSWIDFPFTYFEDEISGERIHKSHFKKLKEYGRSGLFISPSINNSCLIIDFQDILGHHHQLENHLMEHLSHIFGKATLFIKDERVDEIWYSIFERGICTRKTQWCTFSNNVKTTGQLTSEEKKCGMQQISTKEAIVPQLDDEENNSYKAVFDDFAEQFGPHPTRLNKHSIDPSLGIILQMPEIKNDVDQNNHED
ncbi:MAG: hypothetical protein ACON5A_00560 [Candidatus Comchoanobacterales bacterium]